jgi:alcohol dehydrogenase, propanol-preferring
MRAMILEQAVDLSKDCAPLKLAELPEPEPVKGEILVKVRACGLCHTDLDEIEGRTPPRIFPMILGHQIVGTVEAGGTGAGRFKKGDRIGIAWIHSACGRCKFCEQGEENLCPHFEATGRDAPGGYAEYTTVNEDFAYPIPEAAGTRLLRVCGGARYGGERADRAR